MKMLHKVQPHYLLFSLIFFTWHFLSLTVLFCLMKNYCPLGFICHRPCSSGPVNILYLTLWKQTLELPYCTPQKKCYWINILNLNGLWPGNTARVDSSEVFNGSIMQFWRPKYFLFLSFRGHLVFIDITACTWAEERESAQPFLSVPVQAVRGRSLTQEAWDWLVCLIIHAPSYLPG